MYLTVHHAKLSSADRTTRLALETGGFRSEGEGEGGGVSSDLSLFSIGRPRESSQDFFLSFFSLKTLASDWKFYALAIQSLRQPGKCMFYKRSDLCERYSCASFRTELGA